MLTSLLLLLTTLPLATPTPLSSPASPETLTTCSPGYGSFPKMGFRLLWNIDIPYSTETFKIEESIFEKVETVCQCAERCGKSHQRCDWFTFEIERGVCRLRKLDMRNSHSTTTFLSSPHYTHLSLIPPFSQRQNLTTIPQISLPTCLSLCQQTPACTYITHSSAQCSLVSGVVSQNVITGVWDPRVPVDLNAPKKDGVQYKTVEGTIKVVPVGVVVGALVGTYTLAVVVGIVVLVRKKRKQRKLKKRESWESLLSGIRETNDVEVVCVGVEPKAEMKGKIEQDVDDIDEINVEEIVIGEQR